MTQAMRRKNHSHEVCMSQKKRKAKLLQIAEFHAEARRLAGNISANQRRFFEVAAAHGKELEPSGLLAGGRN
jgi:ABC-type branched-subunit amino acid transport system ATPase component